MIAGASRVSRSCDSNTHGHSTTMMHVNWRKYVTVTVFWWLRKATRKLQYSVHQRKAQSNLGQKVQQPRLLWPLRLLRPCVCPNFCLSVSSSCFWHVFSLSCSSSAMVSFSSHILRCGIPVIIMGETGCGKTRLIRYMCDLARQGMDRRNMLIMKVSMSTMACTPV